MRIACTVVRKQVFTEYVDIDDSALPAMLEELGIDSVNHWVLPDIWAAAVDEYGSECDDLWDNCTDTYEYEVI